MNTKLLASLEDAIQQWMESHCEEIDWPNAYVYNDQIKDMAKAAALVMDASVKGQEFAKDEA